MMTARQKKRFLKQFQSQVEQERNGAPVPGEIAARMTKDKVDEPQWQVMATLREPKGKMVAVGPKWKRDAADNLAATINQMVALGQEKHWINAVAVPLVPVSEGVI